MLSTPTITEKLAFATTSHSMSDSQATFAFLQPPSFDVLPDTDVRLGSIHPQTKTRPRRPDTKRILNRSSRVPVPDALYRSRIDPHLTVDCSKIRAGGGDTRLNLPVIQGIGGGVSGENTKERLLYISAKNVETQWFLPDETYFAQALTGLSVQKELLGLRTPPVFLVTGVKIAESAIIITGTKKARGGEIGPEVDLTALGVPVEVGASINARREENDIVTTEKTRLVLAFETRILRMKDEGCTEQDFNEFAMLDDERRDFGSVSETLRERLRFDEVYQAGLDE